MDAKQPPQYSAPPGGPPPINTPLPQYTSPQPYHSDPVSPPPQQYIVPVPSPYQTPYQAPYQQDGGPAPQEQGVVQYASHGSPAPVPPQFQQQFQQQQQQQPQHQQQHQQFQQQQIHPAVPAGYEAHAKVEQPADGARGVTTAYQAQPPMQQRVMVTPARGGDWNASLMDCSPCDSCCLATFLPCILLGKTADRMRDPTMQTADALNSECLVFAGIQCVTGCGWIYVMMKRGEIREHYGIESGSGTGDCCVSYWCPCCALIQHDNEVKIRTSNVTVPVTQGYQPQPGMQVPQVLQAPEAAQPAQPAQPVQPVQPAQPGEPQPAQPHQ